MEVCSTSSPARRPTLASRLAATCSKLRSWRPSRSTSKVATSPLPPSRLCESVSPPSLLRFSLAMVRSRSSSMQTAASLPARSESCREGVSCGTRLWQWCSTWTRRARTRTPSACSWTVSVPASPRPFPSPWRARPSSPTSASEMSRFRPTSDPHQRRSFPSHAGWCPTSLPQMPRRARSPTARAPTRSSSPSPTRTREPSSGSTSSSPSTLSTSNFPTESSCSGLAPPA
mmetsp:Transcript_52638/g.112308  ORF Transcript_52638/g.112308 Transcript_52638/m.112308 type:complete len:230 (+) Transcript_52638:424-1113(+)